MFRAANFRSRMLSFATRFVCALLCSCLCVVSAAAQSEIWEAELKHFVQKQAWPAAFGVLDRELAAHPQDLDLHAWHARVLLWSGKTAEAEAEYRSILAKDARDPDNWAGLANAYMRESRPQDAIAALNKAVALSPQRSDLRISRAHALLVAEKSNEARQEYKSILQFDPGNAEARSALSSDENLRHQLVVGFNQDDFSYTDPNHDEGLALVSNWSPHFATAVTDAWFQRGRVDTGKYGGSLTGKSSRLGALTVGGAAAPVNDIVPLHEAFFEYDKGRSFVSLPLLRGFEAVYNQHWYWYRTARILTLSETNIFYLPKEWTLSVGALGARSAFPLVTSEWKPSGSARLAFPLLSWGERRLRGDISFGAGTENFGQVDQIGAFASQTYGGALHLRLSRRHELSFYTVHQRRTQNRSETSFGFTHAVRF